MPGAVHKASVLLVACALACGDFQRPVAGKSGCQRAVDCLGGERCDLGTHRCVPDTDQSDAGACGVARSQCADDGLFNATAECAAAITAANAFQPSLKGCAQSDDYFSMEVPAAALVEVLAWPLAAANLTLNFTLGASRSDDSTATDVAQVKVIPQTGGVGVLKISAPVATDYALKVNVGLVCQQDALCSTRRCEPLLPLLGSPTPTADELSGPAHCVPNEPSSCGDVGTEPNRRSDAQPLPLDGTPVQLGTCLDDVDWLTVQVPGAAANITFSINCTSTDPRFRPHLMLIESGHGRLEWGDSFPGFAQGAVQARTVPYLAGAASAGLRYLRLEQVAGQAGGNCTLSATSAPLLCNDDQSCTGQPLAVAFGRGHCISQACR